MFLSCTDNSKIYTSTNVDVDSLLDMNKKNFDLVKVANQKSDSNITKKVDNTIQKIDKLETQVEELKQENNELKDKLDNFDDGGVPYGGLPISPN
jgi:peptidoglycan hydrolase CwlO-like protein